MLIVNLNNSNTVFMLSLTFICYKKCVRHHKTFLQNKLSKISFIEEISILIVSGSACFSYLGNSCYKGNKIMKLYYYTALTICAVHKLTRKEAEETSKLSPFCKIVIPWTKSKYNDTSYFHYY